MKKLLIGILAGTLTLTTLIGCSSPTNQEVVYVYNWGDYIDEEVNRMFTEETGIQVIYDVYPTNEEMYARVATSGAKYDVLFPSDYMIEKMINQDLLEPIDTSALENYPKIDEDFINLPYDSNNEYSVPYMWGTMGIVYNTTMVEGEIDSWADMWDPTYKGQIFMIDSSRDSIMVPLKMLGYSMNTRDEGELEQAKQALFDQKELVLAYVGDEGKGKMVNGEAAMMLSWAGDAALMVLENEDLEYVIPKEGTNYFVDAMVIQKDAPNYENALAYIDFLCRPDIAAMNAEYIGYSTPINEARELLSPELRDSEIAYPDLDAIQNMEMFNDPSDMEEVYNRIWTEVRAYQ